MTPVEHRRLAAIMMRDVVGFSRMMAEDESATLARVLDTRRTFVEPAIRRHDGRLVKLMGDGALVEFASVTAAVQCAIEIQHSMAGQPAKDRINLRIGINLGEVIVEDDDIYGDGVNVAARTETLAAPGGVAVSSSVFEQVHQRLAVAFADGGTHLVKNIPNPVQVYQLGPENHWHPCRCRHPGGRNQFTRTPQGLARAGCRIGVGFGPGGLFPVAAIQCSGPAIGRQFSE